MRRPDEELPLSAEKPIHEDVGREVSDHLERRTEELMQQGWDAARARTEAQRTFGDVRRVTDECRDITVRARRTKRRVERFDALWQDIVFALRLLARAPGFAVVAVMTLALGVGANAAIFSVINGLLLRPLPYDHPDRIVDVEERARQGYNSNVSWTNFLDFRQQAHSFDALAEYGATRSTLLGTNEPVRVVAAKISADFFKVMHVEPARGRLPEAADHALRAAPVAVVSQRFWREHLAAAADLGANHLKGEYDMQVIGVLPDGFDFPDHADVWYPIELDQQPTSRTAHNWSAIGRLKAGVTPLAAQHELNAIVGHIKETAGADFDAVGAHVTGLQDDLTGSVRKPLLLLLGASALLLLTACTNLASTLLARGTARSQELAVRTAIGAGRARLIRQIFTESMVIAGLGCIAGVGVAVLLLKGLIALAPPGLTLLNDGRLDVTVLAFTAGVSILTALLFGLLPAFRISDIDTGRLMRAGMRGSSRGGQRIWSTLVAIEVALAVVLLIGSGLLLRSFGAVMNVDLGFRPDHLLTASIDLPELTYPDVVKAVAFHDRALAALRVLPGVTAAGVVNVLPLDGENPSGGIQVEGKPPISPISPATGFAVYRIASTGYFDAMGMRIIKGRALAESDVATSLPVVVVNQALADREWPGADPIGKRLRVSGMDGPDVGPWATVIGVVHNVPGRGITSAGRPAYFFSYRQLPYRARWLTAVIRTAGPPAAIIASVRSTLRQIDPSVPVEFKTMTDRVSGSIADRRFTMILLGAFAAVALLLAGVGIYGVVSYAVAQRTREIGIRIALGAEPRRVGRIVQAEALSVVAVGVAVGVAGALALTRVMQSLLFEVTPTDLLSFGGVAALLIVTASAASWVPARRGTRIDPMVAMRGE